MHYSPEKAGQIINAVCVLHNMCIRGNVALDEEDDRPDQSADIVDDIDEPFHHDAQQIPIRGRARREQLIFSSFQN